MAGKAKFFNMANKTKMATSVGRKKGELGAWVPGTAANTTSTIEISISCSNLPNKDLLSKSDPMVAVFHRPPGSKKWSPMMRTESILDDLNPEFERKIVMEYRFEQVQQIRFEVYDIDFDSDKLANHDMLGYVECTVGQIVTAGETGYTNQLTTVKTFTGDSPAGSITLIAEELGSEKDEVVLKLAGVSCGSWRSCIPPKTYFAVYKKNDADRFVIVYRSKQARGTNPVWPPMKLSCRSLCNGDEERELRIDVFQKRVRVGINHVGSTLLTLGKLTRSQEKIELMSATGQPIKACIKVLQCTISPMHTFLEYLQNGTNIETCFAIDFTCSNGDPSDVQSLHCNVSNQKEPNPYEQAIQAVGTVLKDYDSLNNYPAYGFGARIPPKGEISYAFPLTLTRAAECNSVQGVLDNYRICLNKCQLYGPTNFAAVIRQVSLMASKVKNGENYYILVIITDGVISDMKQTKQALVNAALLPMSVIIIGVGEVDFEAMEELDGDAVRIAHRGKKAQRDIVQFVAYRSARVWMANTGEATTTQFEVRMDFDNDANGSGDAMSVPDGGETGSAGAGSKPPSKPSSRKTSRRSSRVGHSQASVRSDSKSDGKKTPRGSSVQAKAFDAAAAVAAEDAEDDTEGDGNKEQLAGTQFAKEVLAEIPDQIVSYMVMKGITPNMVAKGSSSKQEASDDDLSDEE